MSKVLIVNSYYNYSSTGRIVWCIEQFLRNTDTEVLCAYAWSVNSENEKFHFKYGNVVDRYCSGLITRITGNYYGNAHLSTNNLIRYVKKVKPDVVHIHCTNSYDLNILRFFNFLKNNDIALIVTEHAEFFHTGNCAYANECDKWIEGCSKCPNLFYACRSLWLDATKKNYNRMVEAFSGFKRLQIVTVSPWLENRSKKSRITRNYNCCTILNGIDTDIFTYRSEITKFVEQFFVSGRNVLYVTSAFDSPIKGGVYIIEAAKCLKDINFVIIGPGRDINDLPNVKRIQYVSDPKLLSEFYSRADLTVITSKRETFGMSVAESMCCGTPIIGFLAGGPESVAIDKYSQFVEYGEQNQLNKTIVDWVNRDFDKASISNEAKAKYDSKIMAKEYYELYKQFFKN